MKYYAFEYFSGPHTTTGQPNKTTGRLSIAGVLEVFPTIRSRDQWVDQGRSTFDMHGNCRRAVSCDEARRLCSGMTVTDYNEMVDFCLKSNTE